MKIILIALLCFFCILPIFAQDVEYGSPAELKGLTKVFIDTGTDINSRNQFLKQFQKAKLKLEIADSPDEAEIVIIMRVQIIEGGATATSSDIGDTRRTNISKDYVRSGRGMVFIKGKNPKIPRLLLSGEHTQKSLLLDKPAEKFAKVFVKEYKKANNLK